MPSDVFGAPLGLAVLLAGFAMLVWRRQYRRLMERLFNRSTPRVEAFSTYIVGPLFFIFFGAFWFFISINGK